MTLESTTGLFQPQKFLQMLAETTPPNIPAISSSNITYSITTISWTTNEASGTQVEYDTTTSYGSLTTFSHFSIPIKKTKGKQNNIDI